MNVVTLEERMRAAHVGRSTLTLQVADPPSLYRHQRTPVGIHGSGFGMFGPDASEIDPVTLERADFELSPLEEWLEERRKPMPGRMPIHFPAARQLAYHRLQAAMIARARRSAR